MLSKHLFPLSALACLVAAVPFQQHQHLHHHYPKRAVVWTTKVVEKFVTDVVTTTIHLAPGRSPPAAGPQQQPPLAQPSAGQQQPPSGQAPTGHDRGHGHEEHHRSKSTSTIYSTVTVHRVQPTAQPTVPAETPTTAAVTHSPVHHTTAQPEPSPSPATTAAAAPSPSSGGSGSSTPSGQKYTGDITYYAPGLGSCGITNGPTDMIVALAEDMMLPEDGANPNDNPLCGRSITISYGGKTAVAKIEDTCPGCAGASLDMTPSLFEIFAPLATGRVSGVEWWFN